MSELEISTRTRRRGETFTLAAPPKKFYSQPTNALEIAFKDSDRRTTFERMFDSFKQTFSSSGTDEDSERQNFVRKNKVKLSAVLTKYRERRIECIDSETEANNAPVDLDRQLPSAKLALYQFRRATTPAPPWTALIPKETIEDTTDSDDYAVDLPAAEDEQVFPRMLKYLSFIGVPFMFSSPFRDADNDDAHMPTPGQVFANPAVPNPLVAALRTLPPINVMPATMPARRSREEIVQEGDSTDKCPICLVEIEPGCTVVYLGCDHCYHKECIARWLDEKSTCPVCRKQADMPT